MKIIQIWLTPPLGLGNQNLPSIIRVDTQPSIQIREVDFKIESGQNIRLLLIESEFTQIDLESDPQQDIRCIGRFISRLSFNTLKSFKVIAARIFETQKDNSKYRSIDFPGSPAGISLDEFRLGFEKTGNIDPRFLGTTLDDETEQAITWFLSGLGALNPVEQVICFWIGLESLAPVIALPMRCPKCEDTFVNCPSCGESTLGPAVNKTVCGYLKDSLGVSPKESRDLYALRCSISHGKKGMNSETVDSIGEKAFRLQALLLKGIKKKLGWQEDSPPYVNPNGWSMIGTPAIMLEGENHPNFDIPNIIPKLNAFL